MLPHLGKACEAGENPDAITDCLYAYIGQLNAAVVEHGTGENAGAMEKLTAVTNALEALNASV